MQKVNIMSLIIPKNSLAYLDNTMTFRQGLEKMRAHGYTAIPLIDNESGIYLGTISEGDLLWKIVGENEFNLVDSEDIPITSIIRNDYMYACTVDTNFDELVKRVTEQNFVPIVDDRGILMGIITRKAVINHLVNK